MAKIDVDYVRPCKTKQINDDFAAHVKRGSALPGVDYNCAIGEKIFASGPGLVIQADNFANQLRGRNIIIRHADGRQTHYLHLSELKVKKGERVKAGEVIALSGNTSAGNSTGPHLHFAIKQGNKCIDPEKFLKREAIEARQEKRAAEAAAAGVPVEPVVEEEVIVDEVEVPEEPVLENPPMPKPSA